MTQEDKEWITQRSAKEKEYLLNNDKEIDEIEQENPEYQSTLREAIEELMTTTNKPVELLTREDIVNWLLSLGD